jgi:hypothetical protein
MTSPTETLAFSALIAAHLHAVAARMLRSRWDPSLPNTELQSMKHHPPPHSPQEQPTRRSMRGTSSSILPCRAVGGGVKPVRLDSFL